MSSDESSRFGIALRRPLASASRSMAGVIFAQARSAPDWTTTGFDAQRTSWMRVDPYISIENLPKFQFLWKLKVDNESRYGNSLTSPVALGNLMTFRGFKSLIFVGGSSNNVYAIDYDFGTIFWRTHHNYAAGAREFAGSPACPGGMTLPLTRATNLNPPTQLAFFGFARPPRPAKGDVGEPGKGAPQLAEIAARIASRGNRGGGGATRPAAARRSAERRQRAMRNAPARGTPPPAPAVSPRGRPRRAWAQLRVQCGRRRSVARADSRHRRPGARRRRSFFRRMSRRTGSSGPMALCMPPRRTRAAARRSGVGDGLRAQRPNR